MSDLKKAVLERVILKNFNSFQNEEVPLNSGFTVITGPNGAGKSSIFQGIRFALGSNQKDDRSKKWSDFIRIGQNSGSAEIHIKKGKDTYKIRRLMYKNQAPYFQVKTPEEKKFRNTTARKIHDITEELGYNPDNVFAFVSQGKVVSIKKMETGEICDFLEIGLGLKELRNDIQLRKEKIEKLNKQIKSLDSIKDSASYELTLLIPKLQKLQKKHELLKIKEKLEKEKLWLNRFKLKNEINRLNDEIETSSGLKENFEKKRANLEITIKELNDSIEKNSIDHSNVLKTILEKSTKKESINEKIDEWQRDKDDLADKILRIHSKIKLFTSDLERNSNDYKLIDMETQKYHFELGVTNTARKDLMNEFEEYEKSKEKNKNLMDNFEEIKKNTAEIKLKIKGNQLDIDNINGQINEHMDEIKQLRQELDKYKWYKDNPKKYSGKYLEEQRKKIELAIEKLDNWIEKREENNRNYEKNVEALKTSVLMKDLPKSRELSNLIKEIQNRNLDVIGPIIDIIEFNPSIGPAVDAILNRFVLNSFITKSKNDFLLVSDLIKRSRTQCNVYQTLDNKVTPNQHIHVNRDLGIYGYLADFIKPIIYTAEVKKLILSICRNTVLVKDKSVGYDYIKDYKHRGKIVTLNGTVLQTYKYVLESRSSEKRKDYRNPIEQKRKLTEFKEKITLNRNKLEEYENKRIKLQGVFNTIKSRLNNISSIRFNYRKMTMIINKKNQCISQKNNYIQNKNILNEDLHELEKQIIELKEKLPTNFDKITEFFDSFQEKYSDIEEKSSKLNSTLTNKEREKNTIKITIDSLKEKLADNNEHLEEMETKLKERDSKIFEMINTISTLEDEVKTLKQKQKTLELETENTKATIISVERELNEIKDKISRTMIQIENLYAQIYQKKKLFEDIKIDISELGESYEERTIQEVKNDLKVIYEKLRNYFDVSDDLIIRQKELKRKVRKIKNKKRNLNEEIDEAKKAEEVLERGFFGKFKDKLTHIEKKINERFLSVGIQRKGELKLIGDLDSLGVEIYVTFMNEVQRKLSSLSGGEQTMFAISLMLTLQDLNPSPLCIFDEIQMFLDHENAQEVSKLIKITTTKGIQFIIILPDATKNILQLADSIVGIAKNGKNDISTVIKIPSSKYLKTEP
ncbi:MAG: AAA family ATPase [Promethearchaeota archaeon]